MIGIISSSLKSFIIMDKIRKKYNSIDIYVYNNDLNIEDKVYNLVNIGCKIIIVDSINKNKWDYSNVFFIDVSEVQMRVEELDIPDENLYQEVFDMKSEDKYFNFFSDSNNSQKADKIFQELCNEGLSNKEILKTYKERVDFEIEKEHYSSLSEDKKEEYRNEHPDFKEKYIAQLTGLVKTRDEKINKLRHLKDDVLPQVEDLNKETTENRTAMEEMGGKSHG